MKKDVVNEVQYLITGGKTAGKNGIDIGDGLAVMKIGKDPKGNWSYWIKKKDGKNVKIQTINLNNGSGKIEDIKQFKGGDKDGAKAIKLIKEYLK